VKKLKLYLDNCCYNRPFDDQTQIDYTKWQRTLYDGMEIEEISGRAMEIYNNVYK